MVSGRDEGPSIAPRRIAGDRFAAGVPVPSDRCTEGVEEADSTPGRRNAAGAPLPQSRARLQQARPLPPPGTNLRRSRGTDHGISCCCSRHHPASRRLRHRIHGEPRRRPPRRAPQPHPRAGALRRRRSSVLSASLGLRLGEREQPRQVLRLPHPHLRRVERFDDVELVARSGLARSVPPGSRLTATDGDCDIPIRRTAPPATRSTPSPTATAPAPSTSATPASRPTAPARCSTTSARAATCRRTTWTTCRWPASGPTRRPASSTARSTRLRSDVGRRHGPRLRHPVGAAPQHGLRQARHLLRGLPHRHRDPLHPVPRLRQVGHGVRARARHPVARQLGGGPPTRTSCRRPIPPARPRLRRRRRLLPPVAPRHLLPGTFRAADLQRLHRHPRPLRLRRLRRRLLLPAGQLLTPRRLLLGAFRARRVLLRLS